MQVKSFMHSLPPKVLQAAGANEKWLTLKLFADGVTAAGDQGQLSFATEPEHCDVAVILGWVHENSKAAPHLMLRRQIVESQRAHARRTVIADSNLFLYANQTNPQRYLRFSYDGVFPDSGYYCNDRADPARWRQISNDLGIHLKPWRSNGNHILLCLQRDGGWSMSGYTVKDWAVATALQLRQHSRRCLVIRPHPGDRKAISYVPKIIAALKKHGIQNVVASASGTPLLQDLRDAWAVVGHNSSPAVAAAIEGVPIFQTDPLRSQAAAVAATDLSTIEQPFMPDRQTWVEKIAQCHWSHAELASGQCWSHMRNWSNALK